MGILKVEGTEVSEKNSNGLWQKIGEFVPRDRETRRYEEIKVGDIITDDAFSHQAIKWWEGCGRPPSGVVTRVEHELGVVYFMPEPNNYGRTTPYATQPIYPTHLPGRWLTEDVLQVTRGIYEDTPDGCHPDPADMGILADALEEAGADETCVSACRRCHVWVLRAILPYCKTTATEAPTVDYASADNAASYAES